MIDIQKAIPHRAPFLLVDEVVAVDGQTIRTRRTLDAADPVFIGHYPNYPILPGVLIIESLAQSGAILISQQISGDMSGKVPVLTRIQNAKFKQMVRPGDTLEMEVTLKERLANAYYLEGTARVNGKLAVSVEFACAAVDDPRRNG